MSNTELIKRSALGDIRLRESVDPDNRTVEGYAIVFNQPSVEMGAEGKRTVREIIAPESVTADLLAASDIKFNMFHDNAIILARADKGTGSLSLDIDDHGVKFEFEMPRSMYGDYALDAIRRGDIKGCSFAFSTRYADDDCVSREVGDDEVTYTVRKILGLYDMTVTVDPAYPSTSVSLRDIEAANSTASADDIRRQYEEMIATINSIY